MDDDPIRTPTLTSSTTAISRSKAAEANHSLSMLQTLCYVLPSFVLDSPNHLPAVRNCLSNLATKS